MRPEPSRKPRAWAALLVFSALLLLPVLGADAQTGAATQPGDTTSGSAPQAAAAADEASRVEAGRRDTIRYGIDVEIVDLVRALISEKDARYNDDLLKVFKNSRSSKLRTAILDFFSSIEWPGAEKAAISLVEDRDKDNLDVDLVSSSLTYLAALRSKEALALSGGIVDGNEKKFLPALVKLLGRAGGATEEELLLGWFDSDSVTPALKEEAIKALGDIGSGKAAERLGKLIQDTAAGKAARMFACAALAKIKDASSIDPLVKAANDADPNVRTSAVEALGVFAEAEGAPGEEARGAITEALRDPYVNARVAACKASAAGHLAAAAPFLRYKARSDPEKSVRTEALRSLSSLGGDSFAFLRERLEDPKEDLGQRSLCFGLLCRYDALSSLPILKSRLAAESIEKERSFFTYLAREVSNADKAPGIGELATILISDKDFLIRVAAVEWIRKNKAAEFKSVLEQLAAEDPADLIKKRAAEALKALSST